MLNVHTAVGNLSIKYPFSFNVCTILKVVKVAACGRKGNPQVEFHKRQVDRASLLSEIDPGLGP